MSCIVYDDVLMYAHTALYHDVWRCMAVWDGALGGTMRVSCMERNTAKIQQIHSNFIQQILQQIIHQSPASTAAMHFNCFMIATGYPRLKPPCGPDAEANRAHNEMILAEFAVWLSIKPNAETGKPIQHSSGYCRVRQRG